jgi:hypothetical protein
MIRPITATVFAVIRRADGKAYIDITTISGLAETARDKAKATDKQIPEWAKDNPIIRVSRVVISEQSFLTDGATLE